VTESPGLDAYLRSRGLPPGSPIDVDDHMAWLAETFGGLDVVLHAGDVLEAIDDLPVSVVTHWEAPFTGSASAVLPRATRVEVIDDPVPHAVGFGARPLDLAALEPILVPAEDRAQPKYDSYSLTLLKRDVGPHLRRIAPLTP